MADKLIMLDTSILIDFYRKTDKSNSVWIGLIKEGYSFAISSITKYEIYTGATESQLEFWDRVLQTIIVLPFDESSAENAARINKALKKKRKQIDIADLFIAATALTHKVFFSTLNRKHFDRVEGLKIID
ncbi:MAG: type II toxin-antitoxin system VapC family toxin [Chitinophagaceae bacterium]|jgi:predicted nucleic acid-binding protein